VALNLDYGFEGITRRLEEFAHKGNRPCMPTNSPETHLVDGHVCVQIKDILKQTLALGAEIAWTYHPDDSNSNKYQRKTEKIQGCKAMTRLLKKLGVLNSHIVN
jgi:hypothetical protein